MSGQKIEQYLDLAAHTGAFHPGELEVLQEVLEDAFFPRNGTTSYIILEEREDQHLRGFIIFGRTPMTQSGWDIYWLAVRKDMQRRGVGRRLVSMMQQHVLDTQARGVIRIETSGKKEYAHVRDFYAHAGFAEAGRIEDFYAPGDDLVIFSRTMR